MIEAAATATFRCSADEYLAFVMDPERYSEVDDKIGPIDWVRRTGDVTEFRFRPTMPGLPPAPKVVSRMTLTPGRRIDIAYAPPPHNRLSRRFSSFRASFDCEPAGDGVRVTRQLALGFPPVVRWIVEPLMRRRLQASMERELELTRPLLET